VIEEDEKSEGVSVFVTIEKHRSFFNDDNYKVVGQLSLSHVKGNVMYRAK